MGPKTDGADSEFSKEVYNVVSMIPKGKVRTYGDIAKILKSSPRAVGQALKRNPYAPRVPCHRVIHSDGRIGGYNGVRDSIKKINLLRSEGISIIDGRIVKDV